MSSAARELLAEIEAFLAQTGRTATKFGLDAVNDGHLVANLRGGHSVTLKTADRARAHMASERAAQSANGAPDHNLPARRILLIIGGGIAAYKCLDLIRRLRERNIAVRAVMTKAAQQFITPLAVAALSSERVLTDLFDRNDEHEIGHIRLSREADLIVVAPATADLLAKMAGGHADDLASCVLMATNKPVLVAPAMNPHMWLHSATRRNVVLLQADGVHFVGPNSGDMAERGEAGPGRLAEVSELIGAIDPLLARPAHAHVQQGVAAAQEASGSDAPSNASAAPSPRADGGGGLRAQAVGDGGTPLSGCHVLVTSGPTHEPIDPVRYLANRSSGKQGAAIAAAAHALGASVTLVTGPTRLPDPAGVRVLRVETAQQMLDAVRQALPADVAVFAAAVADWRVASQAAEKIKKGSRNTPTLELIENPDILKTIAALPPQERPRLMIGFAAETQNVIAYAKKKRKAKGADWIVANDVSPATGIMGGDRNRVHLVSSDGVESWPELDKGEVARRLLLRAAQHLVQISVPT